MYPESRLPISPSQRRNSGVQCCLAACIWFSAHACANRAPNTKLGMARPCQCWCSSIERLQLPFDFSVCSRGHCWMLLCRFPRLISKEDNRLKPSHAPVLASTLCSSGLRRPVLLWPRETAMETPTSRRKLGMTRSARWMPSQAACAIQAGSWPAWLTKSISATVNPLAMSRKCILHMCGLSGWEL